MANCCQHGCASSGMPDDGLAWRKVLLIALAVNSLMFAAEIIAGSAADSRSLQADALDFLGDAGNYAISLGVAKLGLGWRARAALVKGATLALLGLGVLTAALYGAIHGAHPEAPTMGAIGMLALVANAGVAIMLYRFRRGDANRQSVWICSRNDAIGNVAVMLAAVGVFGTQSAWPDLLVAGVIAGLGLSGGVIVLRKAHAELRGLRKDRLVAAE